MIEPIMYFGIGFLFAALIGIAAAPFIHDRAARLTTRRLENSIPQSMAEIQADKDLLRAEFAMSARLLEVEVEKLKEQKTSHLADLGRKKDVINRFKIEHQAQKVETVALKSEVESLKARLASVGKKMKAPEFQRYEPDVASLVRRFALRGFIGHRCAGLSIAAHYRESCTS
jgi:polyhydroxyalkanoate synthesis regulator phasin